MKVKYFLFSFLIFFVSLTSYAEMIQTPDGALIYYEAKGEGEAVLFVHGWTMTSKFWSKQVDALSRNFKVIVMDLRAHGNSTKVLHGHIVPQYAKDVRTVIDALKLNKVTLLGWSLAGPVVLDYWKQFGSDRIKALGLVDMTPFPFSPADWNSHGLKNYNYDGMNAVFLSFQENRRPFAERFINNMFKTALASKEDMEWMMREHLKTPTPIAVAIYSDYLMRDYSAVLNTIKVPTIVFAGDSNIFKKGIEMGRYVSSKISKSKFIHFENSGHLPFYEEPEKFNNSLIEFIKSTK